MLKTYLHTACRNIFRYKLFSVINISGLAVGIALVILITLYIWDELTFDSGLAGDGNIYKIELRADFGTGQLVQLPQTAGATGVGLLADYPALIENSARMLRQRRNLTIGENSTGLTVTFADPSFFDIFDLKFIEGNPAAVLPDLSSVAIARSRAENLFGAGSVLGETVLLDDGSSYRVTAVYEDLPLNTHIRPLMIFPIHPSDRDNPAIFLGWEMIAYFTYIELKEGVSASDLRAVLPEYVDRYRSPDAAGVPASEGYKQVLIPIADVHFQTAAANAGDPTMLAAFAAIALIILSIALFNFLNLSISRTLIRAREIAIRKVLGAHKRHIIMQVMSETVLTVLLALIIALVITKISLPWFNAFVSKLMSSQVLATPVFVFGLIALVVVVAVGAGFYPASVMSKFRPANILSGGRSDAGVISGLRIFLVTAQFAIAIGLMIAATVVHQQINYSKTMDVGFKKENILMLFGLDQPSMSGNIQVLKSRLEAHQGIVSTTASDQAPGGSFAWASNPITSIEGRQLAVPMTIRGMNIDSDFADTYGMRLVAGRGLSADRETDLPRGPNDEKRSALNVLINERAAHALGLGTAAEAVGKSFSDGFEYRVVGVIGDYLIGSSRATIPPMHYLLEDQYHRLMAIRYATDDLPALMSFVEETWTEISVGQPILYQFMDQRIAALYRLEQRQTQIFSLFAALAVMLSCVGLYGLAAFSVARRTKEIGIRKVHGASTSTIARHIFWDFSKPVLTANLIAWPVAGWFMRDWLNGFVYRMDLGVSPFLMAGTLALLLAWIAVAGRVLNVARSNPVLALRAE